jgi:electron transfer flavoprotein alpha subunit
MTALVIAEHSNDALRPPTFNTVAAAAKLGGEVHLLIAGHAAQGAADEAAKIAGVSKVLLADSEALCNGLAENVAAEVVALAGPYSHILFPATPYGRNIAPRVAALLDVAQLSDIITVESPDTFTRPIYAGNAIATVQVHDAKMVITVRATGFDAAAATGGSAAVESVPAQADDGKSKFMHREIAKLDRPELTSAKIIVSGGRGVGSGENYHKVLEPLADKLNAAMPASCRMTIRLAKPARSWRRNCISRSAFRVPSSTWPA